MNSQVRRLILDLGPLLTFFVAFKLGGFFVATAAFMVAILAALVIGYALERKISPMPLFTAVLVLIFGGLTLYLQSEVFLKVKVTILYAFFGIILLGGLATGRLFIKYVFGHAFDLDEPGWRKLTLRKRRCFCGMRRMRRRLTEKENPSRHWFGASDVGPRRQPTNHSVPLRDRHT